MIDMIDIYCKDNKCPICEKDIIQKGIIVREWHCENECYRIQEYEQSDLSETYYVYVFGRAVGNINTKKSNKEFEEEAVRKAIRYMKKNNRYLAEILDRR